MRKTFVYIISFLFLLVTKPAIAQETEQSQDSVLIPLKLRIGAEISGPVIYMINKNVLNIEGNLSFDLNSKIAISAGSGYSDYKYSQYNYEYKSKGLFFEAGADFNLLRPETAVGKYWAGVAVHYGLSSFTSETPSFNHENYWGKTSSSLARKTYWGHYAEISTGFRAHLFSKLSAGWYLHVRKLIYTGAGKDLRPLYFPGYGEGGKSFSTGLTYFLVWDIPYKKIRVAIKKETPEEPEEPEVTTPGNEGTSNSINSNR